MSEQKGFKILLAVDGSEHSTAAVTLTARLTRPAGTSAHLLAVVPERWLLSDLSLEAQRGLVEKRRSMHHVRCW